MNNSHIKKLTLSLARSETEDDVVNILTKANLWDDKDVWKEFDGSDGNWSTIGNQQKSADGALVEKIINSVDAVLIKECLNFGINPESSEAPSSIQDAQKLFFNIFNGKLSSIDTKQRSRIAENIYLVASGSKFPSLDIVDLGEGQSPSAFKDTFLSLNKGNKSKMQFVQGKFGMGGTGVLSFGSPKHNLQLIISKRNQTIKDSDEEWGMTVVRRIPPTGLMKSSVFMYLAPNSDILSFASDVLPLLPDNDRNSYCKDMPYGSFIKIFDYQLPTGRLRADITRHLHNRLSLLMPDIALPIKVVDTRHKKSPIKTLSGLSVRLDDDKNNLLEDDFPGSGEMVISGQKISYSIYAFKVDSGTSKKETYASKEGIIFTVNGQTQGSLTNNFFTRKSVGMSYLSDCILITLDCSQTDRGWQESLFMNSRDRLRDGNAKEEITQELITIIKNHPGLRALREKRRREALDNKLQDGKPFVEALAQIIKQNPSLSSLLLSGNSRLHNPYKLNDVGEDTDNFAGKTHPDYFRLQKIFPKENPKRCELTRKLRIQFETNAENDYFKRDASPGEFSIMANDMQIEEYSINLWKGLATLNLMLPNNLHINQKIQFHTKVIDETKIDPFLNDFWIEMDEPKDNINRNKGSRKDKPSDTPGDKRKKESGLNIPNPTPIKQDEWDKHGFDQKSALKVIYAGEEDVYDFLINMDNIFLKLELKNNNNIDSKIIESRYTFGMTLIGLSILDHYKKNKKDNENSSVETNIFEATSAISPVLLPMIGELGNLTEV